MARLLRRQVVDGWYHVFGRGSERRAIFTQTRDREHFEELLAALPERFHVRVHAYAQMDTHYHAVLQPPEANLSAAMQWLHGSYSAWFNRQVACISRRSAPRSVAWNDGQPPILPFAPCKPA